MGISTVWPGAAGCGKLYTKAPPMTSPLTKTNFQVESQVHVPLLRTCQTLRKFAPGSSIVPSGIVSPTKFALMQTPLAAPGAVGGAVGGAPCVLSAVGGVESGGRSVKVGVSWACCVF